MFQIGDRVIVNLPDSWIHGMVGTIVCSLNGSMPGIKFDEYREVFHDLNGICEDGYGFYISRYSIEHYNDGAEIDASLDGELLSLL